MNWIIPAQIEGYRTLKDRTIKISVETNELTPEQQQNLFASLSKFGYLAFNEDAFKTAEIEILDGLEADYDDKGLKPSQRQRNVLYVIWTQKPEGYEHFQHYYEYKMEKIINHLKKQIND
jgi:hypothetical protein